MSDEAQDASERPRNADVWWARDYPVLVEVAARFDRGDRPVMTDAIAESLDMSAEDVMLAGLALERRRLVRTMGTYDARVDHFADVSGAAYTMTGLHPDGDDLADKLVSALRQAADRSSDEDERSNLRKAARALGDLGSQTLAGVATAVAAGYFTP